VQVGFDDFYSPLVRVDFAKQLNLEDISENFILYTCYYVATAVRLGNKGPCLTRRGRITSSISACRCRCKSDTLNTRNHLIKSTHVSSFSSAEHQGRRVDLCLIPVTVPLR